MGSGTVKARLQFANVLLGWNDQPPLAVPDGAGDPAATPGAQVDIALDALGRPWLSAPTTCGSPSRSGARPSPRPWHFRGISIR